MGRHKQSGFNPRYLRIKVAILFSSLFPHWSNQMWEKVAGAFIDLTKVIYKVEIKF